MTPRSIILLLLIGTIFATVVNPRIAMAEEGIPEEIIVAYPPDFPPYYTTDTEGNASGFAIEVIAEVAKRANLKLRYEPREVSAIWSYYESGNAHIIPNIGISERRKKSAIFTAPMETFRISFFASSAEDRFAEPGDLLGHTVGVLEDNIAVAEVAKLTGVSTRLFDSFPDMLDALLENKIDVFAYPEAVVWELAKNQGLDRKIKIILSPLKEAHRAIAIRKDLTELHRVLDQALGEFLNTTEYDEIYRKWHKPDTSSPIDSGYSLAIEILFAVAFLWVFWIYRGRIANPLYGSREKGRSIDMQRGNKSRVLTLLIVMTMVAMSVMVTVISVLYNSAVEETGHRLLETAMSQANLMESMSKLDQSVTLDAYAKTLASIKEGLSPLSGTAEITLGKQNGSNIEFLIRQKAWRRYEPAPIPFSSPLAEPMRKALGGEPVT